MITSEKKRIEKLNRLLDEPLDNPACSVDTIWQALGISRSQLHRTIKEQTAFPPPYTSDSVGCKPATCSATHHQLMDC